MAKNNELTEMVGPCGLVMVREQDIRMMLAKGYKAVKPFKIEKAVEKKALK